VLGDRVGRASLRRAAGDRLLIVVAHAPKVAREHTQAQSQHVPAGTHITAIASGDESSLALTSNGSVLACRNNGSGQLGNGTTTGTSSTPVPVVMPAGIVTVVAADGDDNLAVAVPMVKTSC
jgi:alpha-tubulin suppressor-like RCC1 family protein